MASWKPKNVKDVVLDIDAGIYVLPVIQRRLVWTQEKMELLFDSLLKGNSFGGIMVLKEERERQPLFAFRRFSREGEQQRSQVYDQLENDTYLVIDGQQRLQSFYMALKGSFNGQDMYFNLLSTFDDYEFRFAANLQQLPESEPDDDGVARDKKWQRVRNLFERLREVQDSFQVAGELADRHDVEDDRLRNQLERNVHKFYMNVLSADTVGISSVTINRSRVEEEKLRVVELFRRLNDGATRLSSYDLVASVFKGFDHRMEQFFVDVKQFDDIRFYQDEVIKLIFLLQNNHSKDILHVTREDAEFAIENQERIFRSLAATRAFLKHAGLFDYYNSGGRSAIPLYFIAYHIYYQPVQTADLIHLYDNFDTGNEDFVRIKRWISLSLLNGVFSRGCGWTPTKTGVRKILIEMKKQKGQLFPVNNLFRMYGRHPLRFSEELNAARLRRWNGTFVRYLIYDHEHMLGRDVDHIHPRFLLLADFEPEAINSNSNYQLLDPGTNRNDKRAKPLASWIEQGVVDRPAYLDRHLIPHDPALWDAANFQAFLDARAALILEKVGRDVPDAVPLSDAEKRALPQKEPGYVFDTKTIYAALPEELQAHPILADRETWLEIYKAANVGPSWYGKYRRELGRFGIVTVADFALVIIDAGLEKLWVRNWGAVYQFHHAGPEGHNVRLNSKRMGIHGWNVALRTLKKRGLDWEEYVIEE